MNEVNLTDEDDDEVQIEAPLSVSISCKSSLMPKKKKGVFRKELLSIDRYSSGLQEVNYDLTKASCKACLKIFSVCCDEKLAVEKHMTSYINKKSMKTFEKNSSLTHWHPTPPLFPLFFQNLLFLASFLKLSSLSSFFSKIEMKGKTLNNEGFFTIIRFVYC